jgi:tRNA(Ile)-lysidine synthetase, N-terminal domain/tRNA(Ile)-lysidine synthetase, C-terminal domain
MLKSVQQYIENQQLITKTGKIIVGVSGGGDSVALLHILYSLGYECIVAHCNFHLRGEESQRDEQFVINLAKKYNFVLKKIDFDTKKIAAEQKISIEMAARNLRYEWFENLRKEFDAQAIAVAHHADDNIETLLINLTRGTGLKGLTGIPVKNGYVIRPLLQNTQQEIYNYLKNNNLQFVEDSTNNSMDYMRNRFRHEIIPALEKINPSVCKTLNENIARFTEIENFYLDKIEEVKNQIVKTIDDKNLQIVIDIKQLLNHKNHKIILYEILSDYGFNADTIDKIESCLKKNSGQIFYSEKYKLLHDRDLLVVSQKEYFTKETFFIQENDSNIKEPVSLSIKKYDFTNNFEIKRSENCAIFDAEKLTFPLEIRHWKEGDSFVPFGMKGRKKLSDFFIDKKISRFDKEKIHILVSGEEVLWVMGLRSSDSFKITPKTKKILEITLE